MGNWRRKRQLLEATKLQASKLRCSGASCMLLEGWQPQCRRMKEHTQSHSSTGSVQSACSHLLRVLLSHERAALLGWRCPAHDGTACLGRPRPRPASSGLHSTCMGLAKQVRHLVQHCLGAQLNTQPQLALLAEAASLCQSTVS